MKKGKKKSRSADISIFFLVLLAFAAATAANGVYTLAAVEAVATALCFIVYLSLGYAKRRSIVKLINSVNETLGLSGKDSLNKMPVPAAVIKTSTGELVWGNDRFLNIAKNNDTFIKKDLSDSAKGFSTEWLREGKHESPNYIEVEDKKFAVFGSMISSSTANRLAVTFWFDITAYITIADRYKESRPVVMILLLDNYEDLMKNISDSGKSTIVAAIDEKINSWIANAGGLLFKSERDRYYFVFEEHALPELVNSKFSILENIHSVSGVGGVSATLSIGVGKGASDFAESMQFANRALDMSLSRGGDQAVIRDQVNFSFFGGRAGEVESKTRVKSRVMATALDELLSDTSSVFIMGHKLADIDAIGAACGICCATRKKGKPAYIIVDSDNNVAKNLINKMRSVAEYKNCFIGRQEAMLLSDSQSLLVVVDTNRPDQVESSEVLMSFNKVAVIDHHRRAADYIENAIFSYHEPYASSASELVAELMQYMVEPADILKGEAEALLAGIVLDTKKFTVRTGRRTFEAAAFLRHAGADTVEVKKLFQDDLNGTIERYKIIKSAKLYDHSIAIAALDWSTERILAAQAADELLNISGILTSFVLYRDENGTVVVSARSIGDANVQMILEPLGGGGNAATAGAQVKDSSLQRVLEDVIKSIDKYYSEK